MELKDLIRRKIQEQGPISFCDFMEMALYYPGLGYYTSDRKKIGNDGDFFTSCTISPLFGHMIAKQLMEMWQIIACREFVIVEYGAGTGALCKSILSYFKEFSDPSQRQPQYVIIEKSHALQALQKDELRGLDVTWISGISELEGFTGCVVANEVLDNFAVHRVVMQQELMEVFIGWDNGFTEVMRPADESILKFFADLKITLPAGTRAEVNLQARSWLHEIATGIRQGYIIVIDYGYTAGELLQPHRAAGTLVSYRHHRVSEDFYEGVGDKDITAHVNFSALGLFAKECGLEFAGFRNQGPFLQALGFSEHLLAQQSVLLDKVSASLREEAITNTLITDMGEKFKVLILQKNISPQQLTGFKPFRAKPVSA
jgi:SAM-dependent MidA family methyltransferase